MISLKRILIIGFVVGAFSVPSEGKTPIGSITQIIGNMLVRRDGDSSWIKGRIKLPVFEGDAVATAEESCCEIMLKGDRVARFGEKTTAIVSDTAGSAAKVTAARGSVWINVKHLANNGSLKVATPTAVAAIRGTVFEVECGENSSNYLVFKGTVAVSSSAGKNRSSRDSTFLVSAGEQFTLVKDIDRYLKDEENSIRKYLDDSGEELDKFNREEQEQFNRYDQELREQMEAMLDEEKRSFRSLNDMNYALRPIDMKRAAKNKWILWNQDRDKQLAW